MELCRAKLADRHAARLVGAVGPEGAAGRIADESEEGARSVERGCDLRWGSFLLAPEEKARARGDEERARIIGIVARPLTGGDGHSLAAEQDVDLGFGSDLALVQCRAELDLAGARVSGSTS